MKPNRDPFSFMEDIFSKMKEFLGTDENPGNAFFDKSFVSELKIEADKTLVWCHKLDADRLISAEFNLALSKGKADHQTYKTAQIFLSDLLALNQLLLKNQSEKSQFALAYYYDVLTNGKYADENRTEELNQLISTQDFKTQLEKIIDSNKLYESGAPRLIILSVLKNKNPEEYNYLLQFYRNYLAQVFGLKLESEQQILELLGATIVNTPVEAIQSEDSLEQVLAELDVLIGLEKVKKDVKELINLLEIQKKRSIEGLKNVDFTLHTVFFGPPGTGKTSVARLLSRIFKHLGFLSKGQLYETDREGLIAGYVGQTASKVDAAVEKSRGGVLFIDEAYSLTQTSLGNDYGSEAVNTLLKRMEDYRSDFAVVVAGYTEPMKEFIESNPGLRSRFNRYFYFDHFRAEELIQIFQSFCSKSDFVITPEAEEKLGDTFRLLLDKKDEGFGNARVVRNIFEKCIQRQANRIITIKKLTKKTLKTITEADVPEPNETVLEVYISSPKTS